MNWPAIRAIVRRDVTLVFRNAGVRVPLLVAPFIMLVVLPVLLVSGGADIARSTPIPLDADTVFGTVSGQIQDSGDGAGPTAAIGLSPEARWAVFVLEFFIAPLFLMVPLIVATVIAADSFAGERERRTLEALLYTPTSDDDLLVAKLLAAWLPAVGVALGGFAVYSVVANAVAWPAIGHIFFPSPMWLALAFWVSPALAAIGLGLMVFVSSRVNSLQAAHQLGSLVVLPIVLLLVGQVSGASLLNLDIVLIAGGVLWALAAALLFVATRIFTRDALASRI